MVVKNYKKPFLPPSHAWMVFHTNPCKFEISKLLWNISLSITGLRSPFNLSQWQAIWTLKCVKERKFQNLQGFVWKTTQAWMGGRSCFLRQILSIFGSHCNLSFWDMAEVYRSPNFNMLFQLMLTKFFKSELFLYLPKVGHVINYWNNVSN